MTDTTTPETVQEIPDEDLRRLLAWCSEHAAEPDALTTLNDMGATVLRPALGKDVIATVHVIVEALEKDPAPSAHVHAHMMILLSTLLEHRGQRDGFEAILLRWMRHPASFGPARATPPELQKEGFVQRLADALGWGKVSLTDDKDAISRFLSWVDTWAPKQKAEAGRIVAMMRRNFPQGGELWKLVRVEFNRERDRNDRGPRGGRDDNRGRGRDQNRERSRNKPAAEGAAKDAAPAEGGEPGAAATGEGVSAEAAATGEAGEVKKKRRRRRKRKNKDGTVSAGAPGEGSGEGSDEGSDDGDDGGDDGASGSESAASVDAAPAAPAAEPSSEG
ncbi:MAG: hypothetical protein Q8Q09_00735 [Deltaproteobacteria bacterium]|nr:hypothetical protein [Deltaproteobacteria bacterium]